MLMPLRRKRLQPSPFSNRWAMDNWIKLVSTDTCNQKFFYYVSFGAQAFSRKLKFCIEDAHAVGSLWCTSWPWRRAFSTKFVVRSKKSHYDPKSNIVIKQVSGLETMLIVKQVTPLSIFMIRKLTLESNSRSALMEINLHRNSLQSFIMIHSPEKSWKTNICELSLHYRELSRMLLKWFRSPSQRHVVKPS